MATSSIFGTAAETVGHLSHARPKGLIMNFGFYLCGLAATVAQSCGVWRSMAMAGIRSARIQLSLASARLPTVYKSGEAGRL